MSSPIATNRKWIVFLCWLTVVFEGFDIVALGASIPTILDSGYNGLDALDLTFVSTISLVGVGLGAALIGPLSDRFGRRMPLILCILLFSVFTLVFPLMPNAATMGAVRLVAGLGLGGCMPVAITMMQEAAGAGAKAHSSTLTMTGYHAGAVLASLGALWAGEHWVWLFYIGGAIGLLSLPVMWFKLPETHNPSAHLSSPRQEDRATIKDLLRKRFVRTTLGLWVAAFMGLLLVYGMNTWLPQLMRGAGYNVSSSLTMLFVLNIGAILGLLVGGRVADARGIKGTTMFWFAAAGVLLVLLSVRMESEWLLNGVVLVTGVFVFCAQVLLYGFVGYVYPNHLVGSGMGFVAAVGRLGAIAGPWVTGLLVANGQAYPWGFYFFGAVAVLGLVAVSFIPKPRKYDGGTHAPTVDVPSSTAQ